MATTTTPIRGKKSGVAKSEARTNSFGTRLRKRWRLWLRAVHRDVGYLLVGLTFVYAVSGIAINHIGEWDPNFKSVVEITDISGPFSPDEEEAGAYVMTALGKNPEDIRAVFYDTDTLLEISLDDATMRIDTTTGRVTTASKQPRFFLRVANWLHYNRGKSAWTYIADGYAVLLLYLAVSGIFLIKGKKGLAGRGSILVGLGIALPILYVHFAQGP